MPERQRPVALAEQGIGHPGDGRLRNDLADEHHSPSPFIALLIPDIETQVHLRKIGMGRHPDPPYPYLLEHKSHQADIGCPLPFIQLGMGGQIRAQYRRIHRVIGHDELSPFSGEKRRSGLQD